MRGGLTGGKTANLVNKTNDVKPNTCQRKKKSPKLNKTQVIGNKRTNTKTRLREQ